MCNLGLTMPECVIVKYFMCKDLLLLKFGRRSVQLKKNLDNSVNPYQTAPLGAVRSEFA